jgi:hypothetical protein
MAPQKEDYTMSTLDAMDTKTPAIWVQCGERMYKPTTEYPDKPPRQPVYEIQERTEDAEFPRRLGEAIFHRLVWSGLSPNETEKTVFVKAYNDSLTQLIEFRHDVDELVRQACLASLEFRQAVGETDVTARDAVINSKLDELLAQAACDWRPIMSVLDDKLVSQHFSTLRNHIEVVLSQIVSDFTQKFFELLARLVEREMIGLVEWRMNQCCNYHFFRNVVIQENQGPGEQVIDDKLRDGASWTDRTDDVIGTRTITTTRGQGTHYHRLARHTHWVMNAVHTTIANSRVAMPPQVERLVSKVPQWLYPFVSVIDADIFREQVAEQEVKEEQWSQVQVREVPIHGIGRDPAIIVGRYVLTGWGPREVATEEARREVLQQTESQRMTHAIARYRKPWLVAGAIAIALVALGFLVYGLQGGGGGWISVLATATVIGLTWQAALDDATMRRNPAAVWVAHTIAGMSGCSLLLIEWCIARWFHPLSWATPVALGIAIFLCYMFGRRYWEHNS